VANIQLNKIMFDFLLSRPASDYIGFAILAGWVIFMFKGGG
jgi:hypothetical protein